MANVNTHYALRTGKKSNISTTAVSISYSTSASQGVVVIAPSGNPSDVFIGNVNVNADENSNSGFPLSPNNSVTVPIDDPSKIYGISPSGYLNDLFWICS